MNQNTKSFDKETESLITDQKLSQMRYSGLTSLSDLLRSDHPESIHNA